jgi:hypothetical protein
MKIKKSQLKGLIREVLLEAEQASVFDINTVDKFMDDLKKGLRYFPFLKLSKSTLGGDKNVSVTVHLSLDKKEDWNNNIYHNSRYIIFHFSNQGVLKSGATFSGKNAKASFRKSRFKDAKGAIAKIKQWHDKNKNNPNKW